MTERTQASSNDAMAAQAAPADCTPDQLVEMRYTKALGELLNDAGENGNVAILADSLAWSVAQIMVHFGPGAVGDILRRTGGYVGQLSERRRAEEEALKAKSEGRKPH
jgi:hypothetical protein